MKSHVSLEAAICPVCGQQHQTGTVMIDKRLRDVFEQETVTGYAMCPEHQKLLDDGFVALVGIDPTRSSTEKTGAMTLQGAFRTGNLMHIRASVWHHIFANVPVPDKGLCFVDDEVIQGLKRESEHLDPAEGEPE